MKLKYLSLLTTCLLVAGTLKAQQNFHLSGTITGVTAPTKAFLNYTDGSKTVRDSVLLRKGKFAFTGTVSRPLKAYLSLLPANRVVKQSKIGDVLPAVDGIDLMLEPAKIRIEGKNLASAQVTAGPAQADFAAYKHLIDSVGESVYQIWKAQQEMLPEDSAAAFKRLIFARSSKIRQATKGFVVSHPNAQVSFDMLTDNSVIIQYPQEFEEMYNAISPVYKSSAEGKLVAERLALVKQFAIGNPAIDFSQMDDKGKMVSLAEVNKGKYVLIDFWASWCGPCRMEYPYLKKAYARFKDKNFEIIGISLDDKKSLWLDAIKSNGFEWIELCDLQGRKNAVARAYGVAAIPQSLLIDPNGKIIAKNLRGDDLLEKLNEVIR